MNTILRRLRPNPGGHELLVLAAVVVVSLAIFAYAYAIHPARPGALNPPGWWNFYDQGKYLELARELADARMPSRSSYFYGLGYPVLAVPFVWFRPAGDAFVVVNALAFAATMVMVFVLGKRLRSTGFGVASAGAIVFATPLLDTMVVPWNTTVTVVAVLVALVVATSDRPLGWMHGVALGLAVGMAFAARYVDMLFPALIGAVALARSGRGSWRPALGAAGVALLIAIPVLATQEAVLGSPFRTPYSQHQGKAGAGTNQQSLSNLEPRRIPRNFFEVFVDGKSDGKRQEVDPIGRQFLWAVLAPVGAVLLFRRRHRLAVPLGAALVVSALGSLLYLSYPGSRGDQLIFGNIHYWKAWFPLWGSLAAYAVSVAVELLAGAKDQRTATSA